MPDDIINAYERALGLVGVKVWQKLSDRIRATILDAELESLAVERNAAPRVETPESRLPSNEG